MDPLYKFRNWRCIISSMMFFSCGDLDLSALRLTLLSPFRSFYTFLILSHLSSTRQSPACQCLCCWSQIKSRSLGKISHSNALDMPVEIPFTLILGMSLYAFQKWRQRNHWFWWNWCWMESWERCSMQHLFVFDSCACLRLSNQIRVNNWTFAV